MLPIFRKGRGVMAKKNKPQEYNRIRLDSGQHRRIKIVSLLLGILAFIPVVVQMWGLMVRDYDYYAKDITFDEKGRGTYTLCHNNTERTIRLGVVGMHNVSNSLSAIAAAMDAKLPVEIYGRYWTGNIDDEYIKGEYIHDNDLKSYFLKPLL